MDKQINKACASPDRFPVRFGAFYSYGLVKQNAAGQRYDSSSKQAAIVFDCFRGN